MTTYRVQLDPDSATPSHSHDHEEVFTVVGGSVTTVLDGEHFLTHVGDTMIVPAGAEHDVFTDAESGHLIAAIPSGTVFITPDEKRIADWAIVTPRLQIPSVTLAHRGPVPADGVPSRSSAGPAATGTC